MAKKIKSLLIIFLPFLFFHAPGQAVKLRCLDVQPNGDVTVSWNPLGVGSSFSDYTIFSSGKLNGPYSVVAVISVMAQGNYLHAGAGADADTLFYYILTDQATAGTSVTDTLSTMLLTAATNDNEIIDLHWNQPHFPSQFTPDMYPWYILYREFPPGVITAVDSTKNTSISYHFWECNGQGDSVSLRIGVRDDNYGCISHSSQFKRVLKNLSNRFPPVIDSVSIDAGDHVVIGWEPVSEPDIVGYYIFIVTQSDPPTKDTVDYVSGRLTTSYSHLPADPCSNIYSYLIKSIDSCGNTSPFPFDSLTFFDKPQSNIHLSEIHYDPCLMTNTLSWNEYRNFEPPLAFSVIFVSTGGGPYTVLDTIFPGQSEYTQYGLSPNTVYSYYIRAYSGDMIKTSTSCRKSVRTYNSPSPLFMYTRYVSVENNDWVNILFYTDTNAHVQKYNILRSSDLSGPYDLVGEAYQQGQESISFTDNGAEVTAGSYYYRIEVIDSCGVSSVIANTSRTIFLGAEALPDMKNHLTWNAYESWSGSVLGYRVYRRLEDSAPELIGQTDPSTLVFDDDVSAFAGTYSRISYIVQAYEGIGNLYGFQEESYSNEAISEQESKVYLPNAISPKGINNILKPVAVFVGSEGYEFFVYNRWGEMLFHTSDPADGWNGTYRGQYVPQGVYVWLIRFRDNLGMTRQAKGNVVVVY